MLKHIMEERTRWHRHVPTASGKITPDCNLTVKIAGSENIVFVKDDGEVSYLACDRQWHPRIFASLDRRVVEVRHYDTGALILTYTRIA